MKQDFPTFEGINTFMAKHAAQHTCNVNTHKCKVTESEGSVQSIRVAINWRWDPKISSSWLCAVMFLISAMMSILSFTDKERNKLQTILLCLKYVHIDFFNLSHGWWFLFTQWTEGRQTLWTTPLISSFFKAVFGYTSYISPSLLKYSHSHTPTHDI